MSNQAKTNKLAALLAVSLLEFATDDVNAFDFALGQAEENVSLRRRDIDTSELTVEHLTGDPMLLKAFKDFCSHVIGGIQLIEEGVTTRVSHDRDPHGSLRR
jgi:hypothetical protein